jgi:drug/metabolite transporter superfamily protein YnfA
MFLIHCNEILPTQVRGIGISVSSALGSIASISSPYIFGSVIKNNNDKSLIMIVFLAVSIIGIIFTCLVPETLGRKLIDRIEEI